MTEIGRVLVIDDDPLQLEIIKDYLYRRGVLEVICASDSLIAARMLRASDREPLNLVITDIHMPGLDGIELLSIMDATRPGLPIVLISGAGQEQILSARILAVSYGLNVLGALKKPIEDSELDAALRRHPRCRYSDEPAFSTA